MILSDARIRNFDDQIESVGDMSEIIFEATDLDVDRGSGESPGVTKLNQEMFNLLDGVIFGQFVV